MAPMSVEIEIAACGPGVCRERKVIAMLHQNLNRRFLARRSLVTFAALALLVGASAAHATTSAQQCQSGKNKTAGKYAACRQNAEAKLATTTDMGKYNAAIAKCAANFGAAWTKLEAKAVAKGGACLDGAPTGSEFKTVIDGTSTNVKTALGGGVLILCGNGVKDGSCTTSSRHWTSTSVASTPAKAWVVDWSDGSLTFDSKDTDYSVRAVRTVP